MRTFIAALVAVLLFMPAIVHPAKAQDDSDACEAAAVELDVLISKQPNECGKDEDCDGYYFRADSCAAAVIMMKAAVNKEFEKELQEKRNIATMACASEWANRPACSPIPFRAVCEDHKCTEAHH